VGSIIEIFSSTLTEAVAGGALVALAGSVLTGRKKSALHLQFASVFLVLVSGSVLAAHARTDEFDLLRVELGAAHDGLIRGVVLSIWMALLFRTVGLPLLMSRLGPQGVYVAAGPGWVSSLVLSAKLSGLLPQTAVTGCAGLCVMSLAAVAGAAGVGAFRAPSWSRCMDFAASGVGAMTMAVVWFGAGPGLSAGQDLLNRTALLAMVIYLYGKSRGGRFGESYLLRMAFLGFPFTGLFVARREILLALKSFGSFPEFGLVVMWILPLIGIFGRIAKEDRQGIRLPLFIRCIILGIGGVAALQGGVLATIW